MAEIGTAGCQVCGEDFLVSQTLATCGECLRDHPREVMEHVAAVQKSSRREFDLPTRPPRAPDGVTCPLCANECSIGEGKHGFCGLRTNQEGKLVHLAGTPAKGLLRWYHDPLPTNCVAAWVCEGREKYGFNNLAVFYGACTFNCLFCQNWHFRTMSPRDPLLGANDLAHKANSRTYCVCYFGGDPSAQMLHALATSRILAERQVRICWETNGSMHPRLLDKAVDLALASGGCIKFDLKAYDDNLHRALTGVSNRRTLSNFARVAERVSDRVEPPLLIASTLLIPGYVDAQEIEDLSVFIASINPAIPYSLLGFHPHFFMPDLPRTSVSHAEKSERLARDAGLTNVRIGNRHLLSRDY